MSHPEAPAPREGHVTRAVVASAVGTAIEWYDFFLYGLAAALIFPRLFFPESDPFTGQLLAFSTFFVGFVARPVGAAIFGHYGDRLGRKASLVATLLLMGVATFTIGLIPTYETIGVWGAAALVFLRVLQGIGVGGEWGGSVLLSMEWGAEGQGRRGFLASWPQFGAPLGLLLANGALAFFNWFAGDAFLSWGWRVPFLLSALLVAVGLYIRLGISETPVFERMKRENRLEKAPVLAVLKHQWREVVLTGLARSSQQSVFYIFTTFVLTYGTQTLGFSRAAMINDVLVASAVSLVTVPFWGWVSDRVGRKRMYLLGAIALGLFVFPYFWALDTRIPWLVFAAIVVSMPIHDMQYGPQAALIAESFEGRMRYSGASLGYQLASITAGGPAPIVALWLLHHFQSSMAIAAYLLGTVVVTIVAASMLPDRSATNLLAEFEDPTSPG